MKGLRQHLTALLQGHGRLLARYTVSSVGRTGSAMAGIFLIEGFLSGILGEREGIAADLAASVGQTTALWIAAGLMVAAFLGASLFRYDSLMVEQRIIRSVELRVMEKLVTHLLSLSVSFFEGQERGDMIQSIRQDVGRLRTVLMSYLSLFVEGMLALGLLAAAFLISPLTLAMVAVLLVAALPIFVIARRTRAQSLHVRRSSYVLYDIILQFLSGIRIIKVYRGEEEEARRAVEKTRNYFAELVKLVRVESLASVVLESFSGFSLVFVVVAGGFQVLNGSLEWPSLLAFLMAMAAVHRPLNQIGARIMMVQRHSASIDRIAELMEERSEMQDGELPFPSESVPLVVRDLGFSRDGVKV